MSAMWGILQMLLKNRTSSFSSLVLQTSYISYSEIGIPKDESKLQRILWMRINFSVLADSDIHPNLFEPEFTAEEIQRPRLRLP